MKRAVKKNNFQSEIELKREKYREWVKKNPFPMNHGIEMKECEGCYCQMFYNNSYDFCSRCLDCDKMHCGEGEYDPNLGNCCSCYRPEDKKLKLERKKLSFTQRQRLNWEQVKMNSEDRIEEIKWHEDTDDMRTAKDLEDMERHRDQERKLEKERVLTNLSKRSPNFKSQRD